MSVLPATDALTPTELRAYVLAGCQACRRNHLRVRAFQTGTMRFLDGEPVSPATFTTPADALHERVYRIDCDECNAVVWERGDCPLCRAKNGLARALGGTHGITAPTSCPVCDQPELKRTAEMRMHIIYVVGHATRRVLDAEPHEPGFHVRKVECPTCEETVAEAGPDCVLCGRSSLVRRRT